MLISRYPVGIVKASKLRLLFCELCSSREEFMIKVASKEKNAYKRVHSKGIETERQVTEESSCWLCKKCFKILFPGIDQDTLKKLYQTEEDEKNKTIPGIAGANSTHSHCKKTA